MNNILFLRDLLASSFFLGQSVLLNTSHDHFRNIHFPNLSSPDLAAPVSDTFVVRTKQFAAFDEGNAIDLH